MNDSQPKISIIMPSYNEEQHIGSALDSLVDEYVLENAQIVIVDGMSTDRTREKVGEFARAHDRLNMRIIDNPDNLQSYGLNLGIKAADGEMIVRADAHCLYPREYVKRCVDLLGSSGAANVGGIQVPVGKRGAQKAIAAAAQHPVGIGDAPFRRRDYSGYANAAFLGTFRKSIFDDIGFYDPEAHPNEDSELNIRILKSGRKIYVDGSIQITYFPRESLGALARQYFKYGQGRAYTTWKHRRLTSWRQVAPVALVGGLAVSVVVGVWVPLAWIFPAAYFASLLGVAVTAKLPEYCYNDEDGNKASSGDLLKIRFLMAAAFAVMHVCWGVGFAGRFAKPAGKRRNR